MARYQVATVKRPSGWKPASLDDVPAEPGRRFKVLLETDELFPAVRCAIEFNESVRREKGDTWAVVVEPGSPGRTWRKARLCTPLIYKVAAIWWPTGWEPNSPFDVPNCVWRAQGEVGKQKVTYAKAVSTVKTLNQRSAQHCGMTWYVVMAVENEPVSQSVSYDPMGIETTVQTRRLHVVRPEQGGHGNCAHCPARSFECARAEWTSLERTDAMAAVGG